MQEALAAILEAVALTAASFVEAEQVVDLERTLDRASEQPELAASVAAASDSSPSEKRAQDYQQQPEAFLIAAFAGIEGYSPNSNILLRYP